MIVALDCLPKTGANNIFELLSVSSLLVAAGLFLVLKRRNGLSNSTLLIFPILGIAGLAIAFLNQPAHASAKTCATAAAPVASTSATPAASDTASATPTASASASPTPTPTPTFADGLTLMFKPQADPQYMWYCPNNGSSVCSSSPTRTMTNASHTTNAVNGVEYINIPLATLTSENNGGYFAITVKAPGNTANWDKIGPGPGITCLQRTTTLTGAVGGTGTSFNNVSKGDWTGAGTIAGVQQYHFWFDRCSFDAGVTSAEFYGILK